MEEVNNKYSFFIGTYTDTIHKLEYDNSTKSLTQIEEFKGVKNPSFLKYIKEDNILIAVSETQDNPLIVLIELDKSSNNYGQVIQSLPTHGADPCHISYSKQNNLIFCSNYSGSTLSYYNYINRQLTLIETISYKNTNDVSGEKGNKIRQEASHPHSVTLDNSEKYAFVQDLGCDMIRIYELNNEGKQIQLKKEVRIELGSGPRHLFNKNNRFYLIGELNHKVFIYDFDSINIDLKLIDTLSIIKESNKNDLSQYYSAEIKVDHDNTIYVSIRTPDRIFVIPQNNEKPNIINDDEFNYSSIPTLGKWPRNFNFNNDILIVGNQHSNNIVVFDKVTHKNITQIDIQSPVYIELYN